MSRGTGELTSPAALPRDAWPDMLKRTVSEFKDDKLNHWSLESRTRDGVRRRPL